MTQKNIMLSLKYKNIRGGLNMDKRKDLKNSLIASVIATIITQGINLIVILKFIKPIIVPSYGRWVAVAIAGSIPFVLYVVIYLQIMYFLNRRP